MKKSIYIKPQTLVVLVNSTESFLAGSGGNGNVEGSAGGGESGNSNPTGGNVGSGGDGEFIGGPAAKGHTAWDTWDD